MTPAFRTRATACALLLAAAASAPAPAAAQAQNPAAIVDSFYPQRLTDLAAEAGVSPRREQCFAVLEADKAGNARVILAAYTNVTSGAVRVLAAGASGFTLVAEPAGEHHMGWACEAQRVDLDRDGRYEAHVKFTANNGSEDWVYTWNGQQLVNLTPMTAGLGGVLQTELINASTVDTDGDGTLEISTFSQTRGNEPPKPMTIYRLANGRLVLDRSVVGAYQFQRSTGAPATRTVDIVTPAGAKGPFRLRVFNGSNSGKRAENVVESGRVWLNGQELLRPNDFGRNVPLIERTVDLQAENELRVQLAGAPDGRITIVIDPAGWEQ